MACRLAVLLACLRAAHGRVAPRSRISIGLTEVEASMDYCETEQDQAAADGGVAFAFPHQLVDEEDLYLSGSAVNGLPLLVDMDRTLIQTDLLSEAANLFVAAHPAKLFRLCGWARAGRGTLKSQLACNTCIDVASLPYHAQLIQWLREKRAAGRRLVLVTAFERNVAQRLFAHLGFFHELLLTAGSGDTGPVNKLEHITARFPRGQFEYVGDSWSDMAVWQASRTAHVVSRSRRLISAVGKFGNLGEVFQPCAFSPLSAFARALRPHQWVKNLLVMVPLMASHHYADFAACSQALLALVAFCLAASSVYLLNDLVDVVSDRRHPSKRLRPFAAGHLRLLLGWCAWPLLAASSLALSATFLSGQFVGWLAVYGALTATYTFYLKRIPIVDVLSLAALYTLRIIAGAAAIGVPLSFWLLAFSVFLFLSLAFIKRYSELLRLTEGAGKGAAAHGRGYYASDLDVVANLGGSSGYAAVLVLALYIQDSHTLELYPAPHYIWLACPALLFWISRAWMLAHRGRMLEDPIMFALKDRASWLVAATIASVFVLASMPALG
nr:UbiA family prenyltransferase [Duganella vulcania]